GFAHELLERLAAFGGLGLDLAEEDVRNLDGRLHDPYYHIYGDQPVEWDESAAAFRPCRASRSGVTIEGQVGMDRANGGRALADRGRDSLGRSGADVADGEQSRMAGLERQRGAFERIPARVEVLAPEGQVSEHEPAIVEGGEARQPRRGGVGADEREQGSAGERLLPVGAADPDSGQ